MFSSPRTPVPKIHRFCCSQSSQHPEIPDAFFPGSPCTQVSQPPFSSPRLPPPCPHPAAQCPGRPYRWHLPGTGVMRCLLGGASWWAGRRAGERTAVREDPQSPPELHPPLTICPSQGPWGAGIYLSGSLGHQRLPAPAASPCYQTCPGLWGPPRSCQGKKVGTDCSSLWGGV